jgi:hypothetical protein
MFLHDLVDVTKCGRMAGGHRAHWDVGSISVGACHSMHFRFVILAVLLGISHPAPLLPRYRKHSPQGPTLFVGFGIGDQAMWIVLATMVSLSALALLAACEDKSNNMP